MTDIIVTDHAVLRYIERVHGVDVDQLRAIIAGIVKEAAEAGATRYSVDGFTYAISHRTHTKEVAVTTVLPAPSPSMASLWRGKRSRGAAARDREARP